MPLRVRDVRLDTLPLRTRMPFRYGIATLTECPHLIVELHLEIAGQSHVGLAADNLPPKWFKKDPAQSYESELDEMFAVIRSAAQIAIDIGPSPDAFTFWQNLYVTQQQRWSTASAYPPLLYNFGVSLIERAVIDAFCRSRNTPFHIALRSGALGLRHPRQLFRSLPDLPIADVLPAQPLSSLIVRHTVGLSDPLTDADIPPADLLNDGLPQSLEASIRAYGLTHFKIKLSGAADRDRRRLLDLASLLAAASPDYRFTLDGNENFHDLPAFRDLWQTLSADPALAHFLSRLIFVEQPLHRDVALSESVQRDLPRWSGRPPIIIDESDAYLGAAAVALASGYVGTSHKNCKGVFKGIANYLLVRQTPGAILSAEDLTNIGPVGLHQDLHVAATLGITHLEHNAHHYFAGLSAFPSAVQSIALEHHPDLYRQHPRGFPILNIRAGQIFIPSILASPFGYAAFPSLPTLGLNTPAT